MRLEPMVSESPFFRTTWRRWPNTARREFSVLDNGIMNANATYPALHPMHIEPTVSELN